MSSWRAYTLESDHPMRRIFIEKVVVNIGAGSGGEKLEKAVAVLKELTGREPSLRRAKKTIKEFGVRRGEAIGAVVTLRKDAAVQFLSRALQAVGNRLKSTSFDNNGNVCFGIKEHILIPGVKYDPSIGVWGMDVCVRLARPGIRVQYRRRARSSVGKRQLVTREEAMKFFEKLFGVQIV